MFETGREKKSGRIVLSVYSADIAEAFCRATVSSWTAQCLFGFSRSVHPRLHLTQMQDDYRDVGGFNAPAASSRLRRFHMSKGPIWHRGRISASAGSEDESNHGILS